MIEIKLEETSFEQDIRPLVKAMLFLEEIKVTVGEWSLIDRVEEKTLFVKHSPHCISIILKDKDGKCLEKTVEYKEALSDRKTIKNEMKRILYRVLQDYTQKSLPWGTLTGIRPTKIAFDLLERGDSEEEIRSIYHKEYFTGEEKTTLSIEIAKRERELLEAIDCKNGYSIYIGIPFCPTTCLYCSFPSYPIGKFKNEINVYLQALEKELTFVSKALPHKKLTTVYIGGGTPTSLGEKELERLLHAVNEQLPMRDVKEFTVEAGRPDSLTLEKLKIMKRYGVQRMSINPQSMVDRTLELIGRRHDAEAVRTSFGMAREIGFTNINMDLIIGLPGEGLEEVAYTLSELEKLDPDDITIHALAIKRAAGLKQKLEELSDVLPVRISKMQDLTYEYAKQHEYYPYYLYRQKNIADNLENVGFAREGKEGLYNILIMEEKQPILGLGAGSSSKYVFRDGSRIERTENVKFFKDYIERLDEMIERKKVFLDEFGEML